MEWEKEAEEYIQQLKPVNITTVLKQKVFSLIDLTSLNDTDTTASIAAFSEKSISPLGHVAAICVYPQFVRLIAAAFSETPIKVATVANFPHGKDSLESVMVQIGDALENGAQEMDVVFPYERFLAGEHQYAELFITTCKAACGDDVLLKVILETGALPDLKTIAEASRIALFGGADFIKTSTGKIAQGATLEAVVSAIEAFLSSIVIRTLLPFACAFL